MAKVMPKVLRICRILLGTGRVCLGDMPILAEALLWQIMSPYWNYKTIWVCLKTGPCPENPVLCHHFWFWFAIYNHITTNVKFEKYHPSLRKWFRGGVYTGKGFDWEPIPSAVRLKAPAHAGDTFWKMQNPAGRPTTSLSAGTSSSWVRSSFPFPRRGRVFNAFM